jgi:hydroxyquinol 1,2-dioxygenase
LKAAAGLPAISFAAAGRTHLFKQGDQYINTDVVFGVKEPLITEFVKKPAGAKAPTGETMKEPFYEVHYDFVLQKAAEKAA